MLLQWSRRHPVDRSMRQRKQHLRMTETRSTKPRFQSNTRSYFDSLTVRHSGRFKRAGGRGATKGGLPVRAGFRFRFGRIRWGAVNVVQVSCMCTNWYMWPGVGGWGTQAINSAMSDWEERCPAILPIILNLGCTAALLSLLLGVAADQGQCAIRSRVFGNRYSNVIYVR